MHGVSLYVRTVLGSEETAVDKTMTALVELTFTKWEDFCYRNNPVM